MTPHSKVTLIEPGTFNTNVVNNLVVCPQPSAYAKPGLPTAVARKFILEQGGPKGSDMNEGIAQIYKLASLESPPLRFPLGMDAVNHVKNQLSSIARDVDKYASWSAGLVPPAADL